jgi:outer membrane protein TolC
MLKKPLFLALVFGCTLQAQMVTLQESIEQTLHNHPDIKSFVLKIEHSESAYKSEFSAYMPQINLSANYNVVQTYVLPSNGSFNTLDDTGWSVGVNLKQKIWDFSYTSSKVAASKLDKSIAKLSLQDMKALLVYKVTSLYELMIVQKEAIEVRQKDLETKQAYYEQAQALVKEGLKTTADASRFLSAVYNAQDNLASAKVVYEKAKNSLGLYMGKSLPDTLTLERDSIKNQQELHQNIEEEILKSNYQLSIFLENIQKNILLHKASKSAHYGSLDAVASYTHLDTLNSYNTKVLGVTLNIPLYSGGKLTAQAQKAKIASQIAKEQYNSKTLALKEEIESLLLDIKRYKKTIEAKKAQLTSAEETKKVLDGRYKEGLATYIEVLDATSIVLGAKLGLLEAYYLKSMALHRIEYLKGKVI